MNHIIAIVGGKTQIQFPTHAIPICSEFSLNFVPHSECQGSNIMFQIVSPFISGLVFFNFFGGKGKMFFMGQV